MDTTTVARAARDTVLVAAATVATWFAWLGTEDDTWTPGELVGCLVTLAIVLVVAQLAGAGPVLSSTALTVAFLVPATWVMAQPTPAEEGFNFWPIASALLLGLLVVGCTVLSLLVALGRVLRRRSGLSGRPPAASHPGHHGPQRSS